MALLNKVTWKNKFSDFINRVSPFNTFPLIQKVEHEQLVGSDLGDSVIFRQPSVQVINSPLSAISVNFDLADRFDIDTTGSAGSFFEVDFFNLQGNETAILNITKKLNDTFEFNTSLNAVIATPSQLNATTLIISVKRIGGFYYLTQLFPGVVQSPNAVLNDGNTGIATETKIKILEIGSWNMQTTTTVSVFSGVNLTFKIRAINVIIRGNTGSSGSFPSTNDPDFFIENQTVDIDLTRSTGGVFDNSGFNDPSVNRGFVVIIYEE